MVASSFIELNFRTVDVNSGSLIKDVGQQIHTDANDDLNDLRIDEAALGLTAVIRGMMTLLGINNFRFLVWVSDFILGTKIGYGILKN
jgi:hypothetical protein